MAVNVYIDGYNFYYSISKRNEPELLTLGWCNFFKLAKKLVNKACPGDQLGAVKYYTADVGHQELRTGEAERQRLWLEALKFGTKNQVQVIKGFYGRKGDNSRTEKQTDVNLAISLVRDCFVAEHQYPPPQFSTADEFSTCDAAIIVSADRDFLPAAKMVASIGKKVAIARPLGNELQKPERHPNIEYFDISKDDLTHCRLPDRIERDEGKAITWARYSQLKDNSRGVPLKPEPPDPIFDAGMLEACRREAEQSCDPDTQVGCVVIGHERKVTVRGHNHMPSGIDANPTERLQRPGKYAWIEHAERNAIYRAARNGTSLEGHTMYVCLMPCVECARAIIQAGIREVVVSKLRGLSYTSQMPGDRPEVTKRLLQEAGIAMRFA